MLDSIQMEIHSSDSFNEITSQHLVTLVESLDKGTSTPFEVIHLTSKWILVQIDPNVFRCSPTIVKHSVSRPKSEIERNKVTSVETNETK